MARPRKTASGVERERPGIRERLTALRLLPPFLRLVWQTRPSYATGIVALRVVQAAGAPLSLWVGKLIFDILQQVVAGHTTVMAARPHLLRLVLLEFAIAASLDVFQRASSLMESLLSDLFSNRISVRLMEHAAALDLEQFEDPLFYDHLERARGGTVGRIILVQTLLSVGQSILTLIMLLGALLAFSPWLLLLLALAVMPSFVGETHFAGLSYSLLYRWTPERRRLDYLRYVATSDRTAKEVKLFGLSDHLTSRYATLAGEYYEANKSIVVRRAATGAAMSAFSTSVFYGAYVYLVWRTVEGVLTLGDLTFTANAFRRCRDLLSNVLLNAAGMYEDSLFLKDLFVFFEMEPRIRADPAARAVPSPILTGFRFENVGFMYPGTDKWALRNVSFDLGPAERIALVGENGAGKTTLVKLIARLYDPTEGRILLDGVDIREYDVATLRRAIGVIFQDFVRYESEMRENIAVGNIEEIGDQPMIEMAAEKSLARSVIDKLPLGYDQMLGRRFENGAELSGGEWQKVALARAYMRDAQILVLDEPTSALDARAEYEVFQRFTDLTRGRIAILISHRFSTVRMADRIIVIEHGTIIEQGSHDALLTENGRYAELFRLQAAGYR